MGQLVSLSELRLCMLSEVLLVLRVFTLTKLPVYIGRTFKSGLELAEIVLDRTLWFTHVVGMEKSMSSLLDGGKRSALNAKTPSISRNKAY